VDTKLSKEDAASIFRVGVKTVRNYSGCITIFFFNSPMLWPAIIHHIHLHQLVSQFIFEHFIYRPIEVLNLTLWQNIGHSLMQFCQMPA
jgi:hypothetical protein